jgi:hypothetical protein
MDAFHWIIVPVSTVLGLTITRVLTGLCRCVQGPGSYGDGAPEALTNPRKVWNPGGVARVRAESAPAATNGDANGIEDFQGTTPVFLPEEFFHGRHEGWSVLESLVGGLQKRSTIIAEGAVTRT